MTTRAVWRASSLVASLCSISLSGHAQSPNELGLSVRDCPSGASQASPGLLELVRLELRADGVTHVVSASQARPAGPRLWVERDCDVAADGSFVLGYDDAARDRHLERSLRVNDVPVALRERALALALAELFRAGEAVAASGPGAEAAAAETVPSDTPQSDPAQLAPAVVDPPAADGGGDSARRPVQPSAALAAWALELGPALHVLPATATTLFGAELAVRWRSLSGGVLGNLGSDGDALGDIGYRRLHVFVTYDALSTEPAQFQITAGVRAAFGATFANVTPTSAALSQNVVSASGDVGLEASIGWIITSAWHTRFSVAGGYAFGPRIQADDRSLTDFSGMFIGASLRIVAAFGAER